VKGEDSGSEKGGGRAGNVFHLQMRDVRESLVRKSKTMLVKRSGEAVAFHRRDQDTFDQKANFKHNWGGKKKGWLSGSKEIPVRLFVILCARGGTSR